jgi:hypothetical protein
MSQTGRADRGCRGMPNVTDIFEDEYGPNIVADVEAAQHSPYMINVTVYVTEKKEEMRDLCQAIGNALRNHGVRAGVRTELVAE